MLVIVLLIGLILGSFANVLIARSDDLWSIAVSRSHCPNCKKTIKWFDLVPVLSYFLLRGRCRSCHESISWQYPVVECVTALVALHLYLYFGLSWISFGLLILLAIVLVLAVIDLRSQVVPDMYSLSAILLAYSLSFYLPVSAVPVALLIGGGFLTFLALGSRQHWMGTGDVAFGLILALITGISGLFVGLVVAFILGSLISVLLVIMRKASRKSRVPFVPFLAIGIYVALFYGDFLSQSYLRLIGY